MKTFLQLLLLGACVVGLWAASFEVEGTLVDIRPVTRGGDVFPQLKDYRYGKPPALIDGLHSAVGLPGYPGVAAVRSAAAGEVLVGLPQDNPAPAGWENTQQRVYVGQDTYYAIFRKAYDAAGQRLDIPQGDGKLPPIVFAKELSVRTQEPPGVVIGRIERMHSKMITNPNLVILPNGDYLASANGLNGFSIFISKDKGQTWSLQSNNQVELGFSRLFWHRGALYIMGVKNPRESTGDQGYLGISRSDDAGKTWTPVTDENSGVLMPGHYHTAPVSMVEYNGRIWRAMELRGPKEKDMAVIAMGVVSAPADADLLKAKSWTLSQMLPEGKPDAIEGNVVVAPDGTLKNLLRYNAYEGPEKAAVMSVDSPQAVRFDAATDVIDFPGGAKKFTLQYDPVSKLYWAITNPANHDEASLSHPGRFAQGVHNGLLRNRMALISSPDLKTWTVKDWLIVSDNPFFDGFQYVDWKIDGDDIVAVSRTAFGEPRGLPVRQHDANLLTFHRFKNFRTEKIPTIELHTLPKPLAQP